MLPVEGNGEEDDSEAQEKSKYSKEKDNKEEMNQHRSNGNTLNSNRRHVGIKPLGLHTSTTSTDDLPLSSSGRNLFKTACFFFAFSFRRINSFQYH